MKAKNNYTTREINRNWKIKVYGMVNGVMKNTLVGVKGLLEILGGDMAKLQKIVSKAFDALSMKFTKKLYGGAKITFYAY